MNESVADVYAGDIAPRDASTAAAGQSVEFKIEADADPDACFKIVGVLNLAHRCPAKVSSAVVEAERTLVMQVRIDAISLATAESLRRKLDQLTCIRSVELMIVDTESPP